MQVYIQDRTNDTIGTFANFTDDKQVSDLAAGVSTIDFKVSKSEPDADKLIRGNYVVFVDENGDGWKFTIMSAERSHNDVIIHAEDLGLELINKVRNSWPSPSSAQPFKYYFDKATAKTGWTLGINEISNLNRTLSWDGRDTALKRLLSICTQFDNAEIEFKVEFNAQKVTKKVVNVYKKRGNDQNDVQLVYGDRVDDIKQTEDITDLATALQGVGGVIENSDPERHVDFSDLTYDDGDYFTVKGDPMLYARTANRQFNIKDTYLEDFYDYDTQSASELLNRTLSQLKKRSQPAVNYEISLATIDTDLHIGDTVLIIDHDYQPELLLSARLLQLTISRSDPSQNSAIFGNYLIVSSGIDERLRALQELAKTLKNGKDGTPGKPGTDGKGIASTTVNYQASTSGTNIPTGTWLASIPAVAANQYLWTRTTWTYTDNTSANGYSVGKMGANGAKGDTGNGIKSVVASYQNSTSGTVIPTGSWATTPPDTPQGQYLWTRNLTTFTNGSESTSYSVAYNAKDGPKGEKGDSGSKDVTMTYVQTTAPTNPVPKKGDIWWVGADIKSATALRLYNGTAWVNQAIGQDLLVIKHLVSVTIDAATINSPNINIPFTNLALPGFPEKMTGAMTIKDAKYSVDGKYDDGPVFHTGITPAGWESYRTTTDGNTKLTYAGVRFGELQLWNYLSGSGSSAKYLQGSLSAQDTYRNSGNPSYLNGWALWSSNFQTRIIRNGRTVTLSGYIKHNNSANVSPILQVPAWALPLEQQIVNCTSYDSDVKTAKAGNLALQTGGKLVNNAGVQKGGYLSFSVTYVGADIKQEGLYVNGG